MGRGRCYKQNEPYSCGINGGNLLFGTINQLFNLVISFNIIFVADFLFLFAELTILLCLQKTVFGGQPTKPDYSFIPCAVFR